MPNLSLKKKTDVSSFRRIAIGTWRTVGDPSVYGSVTLRMGEALRYQERFRAVTGKRITLTHMMARAIAAVLEKMPDANAILRFNRIYLREDIGVFFQVAMEDAETGEIDLSGTTIKNANKKSLEEVVDEFAAKVAKVKAGKDKELEGTRTTFKRIPFALLGWVLRVISLLVYTFNLDMRWAGIPQDAFGSVMVTNVGSLGLEEAYVPLVPYSRVPLLLAMGAVQDSVLVEDGEIVVGKTMRVFATFDHRVLDGSHAAIMVRVLREWFEHPFDHFDALDGRATGQEESSVA